MAAKNAKGAENIRSGRVGLKPALLLWRIEKFAQAKQIITDNTKSTKFRDLIIRILRVLRDLLRKYL